MKKKILLFGATGSVGIYLTEYLYNNVNKNEYEIVPIGRRKTSYFERYNMPYYSVSIDNKESLEVLPKDNIYAIIMLSGLLPAGMSEYRPERYIDVNVKGILNIMEYFKNSGVDRTIYTISISDLHGHLPDNKEFMPDMPIKYRYGTDHTIYAISKTAASQILETYHQDLGIKNFILRLPNIYLYSPDKYYYVDCEKKPISYRFIIDKAINGEDIELWGNPNQKREIVYVKDLCQIVYKSLWAEVDGGYFNVGADLMVSMKEQIEGIVDVFSPENNKSRIVPCPEKKSCDDSHMNIEKTRKLLGYVPEYGYVDYLEDYKKEMNSDRFDNL